MYDLSIYRSIHQIPPEDWNAILDSSHVYHRHEFISLIEDARIENSKFWYLLCKRNGIIVATACLCSFDLSLLVLMGRRTFGLQYIKKLWPRFLNIKVLICGLPISLGQSNLIIREGENNNKILDLLTSTVDDIALLENVKHIFMKEFDESATVQLSYLERLDFTKAYSLPYMELDIRWNTFNDFLAELRHPYRRKIKRSLAKLNMNGQGVIFNNGKTGIRLNQLKATSVQSFYEQYLSVMQRAEAKLEVLNKEFFELFFKRFNDKFFFLEVHNNNSSLASGILIHKEDTLHFMLLGNQQEKNPKYDPYFNLLYATVQLAIDLNCTKLKLGQTAYWVKQQIGGKPKDTFIYYRSRNSMVHYLLRQFRNLLFPKLQLSEVEVFKNKEGASKTSARYATG